MLRLSAEDEHVTQSARLGLPGFGRSFKQTVVM